MNAATEKKQVVKARVERLNIYENAGHVPACVESVKTIEIVKRLDDGRLLVRFGKRTGTINRSRTELQACGDGKRPVRYGLIEVVEGALDPAPVTPADRFDALAASIERSPAALALARAEAHAKIAAGWEAFAGDDCSLGTCDACGEDVPTEALATGNVDDDQLSICPLCQIG